jgi:hypothetical protein
VQKMSLIRSASLNRVLPVDMELYKRPHGFSAIQI